MKKGLKKGLKKGWRLRIHTSPELRSKVNLVPITVVI